MNKKSVWTRRKRFTGIIVLIIISSIGGIYVYQNFVPSKLATEIMDEVSEQYQLRLDLTPSEPQNQTSDFKLTANQKNQFIEEGLFFCDNVEFPGGKGECYEKYKELQGIP